MARSISLATSRAIYDDALRAFTDAQHPCHRFRTLQPEINEAEWQLPEPFNTVRRSEAVERHVPLVPRDRVGEALDGPADADQPRPVLLQSNERAVVMALAAAEARAAAVDGDQRDEDQVGIDRRMALGGLRGIGTVSPDWGSRGKPRWRRLRAPPPSREAG